MKGREWGGGNGGGKGGVNDGSMPFSPLFCGSWTGVGGEGRRRFRIANKKGSILADSVTLI